MSATPLPAGLREYHVWVEGEVESNAGMVDARSEKHAAEMWAETEGDIETGGTGVLYDANDDGDEGVSVYVKNPEGVISRWNTTVRVKVTHEAQVDEHYGKDHTCAHCGLVGDCYYNQPLKKFYCREGCEAAKGRKT